MLRAASILATGFSFGHPPRAIAAPRAQVLSKSVISKQPHLYHGWPTIGRRLGGGLLLVYSGGREAHVCPFGRVELMRSNDGGENWSFPRVLLDSPIDDRDSGVLETAKGTLLVATFTSLAYASRLEQAGMTGPDGDLAWSKEKLNRWRAVHERLAAADRESLLGSWMMRSTDGGNWWSAPYRCPVNTPHGPIQVSDGRLLYIGTTAPDGRDQQQVGGIAVYTSTDDGQSWGSLADIPARPDDSPRQYSEPHAVETVDGALVAHIRFRDRLGERETLQTESYDGGKTWSIPRSIGVRGFPSHLLRLEDGRLLMTHGHRRRPLGVQARLSQDNARTWSEAIILSGDGTSTDVGYPSTVELDDGSLLTVWYELLGSWPGDVEHYHKIGRDEAWFKMTEDLRAVLRQACWSIQ
jgi:hypothetical protein